MKNIPYLSSASFDQKKIPWGRPILWSLLACALIFGSSTSLEASSAPASLPEARKTIERLLPPESGKPPVNSRVNLGTITAMIEKCEKAGFTRELAYWETLRDISSLRLRVARAVTGEAALSRREVEKLRGALPENRLAGDARVAAVEAWQRVDAALAAAALPHSWLLVKNRLTADLADRLARAEYYTDETLGAEDLRARVRDISAAAEEWETDFADCFFGRLEQEARGDNPQEAEALAVQAEALASRTEELEARRMSVQKVLLTALLEVAPGGDFETLGVPRRKPVTIDADGMPSDLLFSGLDFGYPYTERRAHLAAPFCFDVLDYAFQGLPLEERDKVAEWDPGKLKEARRLAEEEGYFFKQPFIISSYFRKSHHLNLKLLPDDIDPESPELYLQDFRGERAGDDTTNNRHAYNIWHPAIRSLVMDTLETASAAAQENIPNLLLFEKLGWEAGALGNFRGVYGYNREALERFRAQLADTYGTIEALNAKWGSDYASFDDLRFPRSPFRQPIFKPDALSYEFQKFRTVEWSEFIGDCVRAIQKGAPGLPVGTEESGMLGNFVNGTVPSHRLWKTSPAIFFEAHHNNWAANYPSLRMHYDLCLYAGKQPIETEWIWTFPRLETPEDEDGFRVTGRLSFWRKMVWGRKILQAFAPFTGWSYNNNLFDERHSTVHNLDLGAHGTFLREAATGIVLAKKHAREFWPVLSQSEVAKPKVGLLVPTTSMFNEFPYVKLSEKQSVYYQAFCRWDFLLRSGQTPFRHIPEEAILDGDESLEGFKVMILPYTTYFPDGLAEKLLAWTRAGGTILAEGVPDVFSAHGHPTGALVRSAFAERLSWEYTGDQGKGNNWSYRLQIKPGSESVRVLAGSKENPVLVEAPMGKGRLLVSARPFGEFEDRSASGQLEGGRGAYEVPTDVMIAGGDEALSAALFQTLRAAAGPPPVFCENKAFETVLRETPDGNRFLFVANPSLTKTTTETIILDFPLKKAVDLGLGPEMEVPLESLASGASRVRVRLVPGGATCLALTP